jgi:hypothetical protein
VVELGGYAVQVESVSLADMFHSLIRYVMPLCVPIGTAVRNQCGSRRENTTKAMAEAVFSAKRGSLESVSATGYGVLASDSYIPERAFRPRASRA